MSTNFPASLDAYSTKAASETISEAHINDPQDAIEIIEQKVGTGVAATVPQSASTNTALVGYGASLTGYQVISLSNKTLTPGLLTAERGGTGATNSNTAGGTVVLDAVPSVPTKYGGTSADLSASTIGMLPYFSATGTMSALATGSAGEVLFSGGGAAPTWNSVYDSGWFIVSASADIIKTHNLGTTKIAYWVWFSTNSDGAVAMETSNQVGSNYAMVIGSLTSTQLVLSTGVSGCWYGPRLGDQSATPYVSGYARILMLSM